MTWLFAGVAASSAVGWAVLQTSAAPAPNVRVAAATSSKGGLMPPAGANYIADVVEQVSPAVVYIHTTLRDPLFGRRPVAEMGGAGFIVSADGLVLTNAHVVSQSSSVSVKLQDGRELRGRVLFWDQTMDVALVQLELSAGSSTALPVLPLGDSSTLRPGEWVLAIGSPLSLTNSVTVGVVSAAQRQLDIGTGVSYVQTDAAITRGNSGGPLVDLHGRAIGINTITMQSGFSFAIPINQAAAFLAKARQRMAAGNSNGSSSSVRRFSVGMQILWLTADLLEELRRESSAAYDLVDKGILVYSVAEHGPAWRAGLRPGDVIVQLDGVAVKSSELLFRAVELGKKIEVDFMRRGRRCQTRLTPAEVQ